MFILLYRDRLYVYFTCFFLSFCEHSGQYDDRPDDNSGREVYAYAYPIGQVYRA